MKEEPKVTELGLILKSNPAKTEAPLHYWQHCVNCGMKLDGRKCRLFCPECGFSHSCSEP